MMALQAGRGVVAEDDLLVLGAELEDVDRGEGAGGRHGLVGHGWGSLSCAWPRGGWRGAGPQGWRVSCLTA